MMERIRIETIPQVSQHILAVSQAADAKVAEKEVLFAEERRHYQTQYELALADCEALAVRVREREQEAEESARRLELLTSEHRSCSDKEMECWEALQRAREELKNVKVQADKQSLAKDEEISQLREALLAAREQADQRIRQIQTETGTSIIERFLLCQYLQDKFQFF
jgi:multidrug resistance efflux pump